MDKNEMLPCPFCGDGELGEMEMTYIHTDGETKGKRIKCNTCGAMAQDTIWNTRTHHAEIEAMEKEAQESHDLREKLSDILTRTANALKGKPAPLHSHSWHDLPEVAEAMARDAHGERSMVWEVWQEGLCVASSDSMAEAKHYLMLYGQDGPVTLMRVISFSEEVTPESASAIAEHSAEVSDV